MAIPALVPIIVDLISRYAGDLAAEAGPELEDKFDSYRSAKWSKAHGYANDDKAFDTGWRGDHATFGDGNLILTLDNTGCPERCSDRHYSSGEYRSKNLYGDGLLEGRLKAAKGDGLVTTLFFYTDSQDHNPHDEIDIEILGKDPTKMQINYYTDGVGKHEKTIDLGFDASEGFHTYGIKRTGTSIEWYVDGKLVTPPETGARGPLPTHPGRIMMSLWAGSPAVNGWLNPINYTGPVKAEYDFVRFTPLEAIGRVPSPVTLLVSTAKDLFYSLLPARDVLPGEPDPALGKPDPYGRPLLNRLKVEKNVPLEQLEKALLEIADAPVSRTLDPEVHLLSTQVFFQKYPELAAVKELDDKYDYKLFQYQSDFRTYWDNSIILLSVYVQKITEDLKIDKKEAFRGALEIADRFMERIEVQLAADDSTGKMRGPSTYSINILKLIKGEIRAQIETEGKEFYDEGISLVADGIRGLLAEDPKGFKNKPDYYSITKGMLILGDLYTRRAVFGYEGKYYDLAEGLYNGVINLDRRDMDLVLADHDIYHYATRADIEAALDFNIGERYITEDDKDQALLGIYHQLKGIALIKRAALYTSRPSVKTIDDIVFQFGNTVDGMIELRNSTYTAGFPDEKNAYFYNQAKVIQGELLMLLADRINLYHDKEETIKDGIIPYSTQIRFLEILDEARSSFPDMDERFARIYDEIIESDRAFPPSANRIIAAARDLYFKNIPGQFKYLNAQSIVKILEIAIRNADFIYIDDYSGPVKIADAEEWLGFVEDNRDLISEIAAGKVYVPEFLQIEYNYLESILRLTGIIPKDAKGKRIIVSKARNRKIEPLKVLELVAEVEKDITKTPAGDRVPDNTRAYFEVVIANKEAAAMVQISESLDKKLQANPEVKARILKKSGKEMTPIEYAFWLMKKTEKLTGPALPPYLGYNMNVTLKRHFQKWNQEEINKITRVLDIFIKTDARFSDFSAESFKDGLTVKKLSAAIDADGYGIAFKSPPNTIERLNELLLQPDFYDRLVKKGKKLPSGKTIYELVTATSSYRHKPFDKLSKFEQANIKNLNRLLLEAMYPGICPTGVAGKFQILNEFINKKDVEESKRALASLSEEFEAFDTDFKQFVDTYVEINAWDMHTVRAELYHNLTTIYGILTVKNPELTAVGGDYMWQYAQSAYMEARMSTSPYDQKHRHRFIRMETRIKEDKTIYKNKKLREYSVEEDKSPGEGQK